MRPLDEMAASLVCRQPSSQARWRLLVQRPFPSSLLTNHADLTSLTACPLGATRMSYKCATGGGL